MKKGFTLIELLVVIAIIAILAVVVVLTINPTELLRQANDANRVSDMSTLNKAISFYYQDAMTSPSTIFMGTSSVIYVSVPDPTATSTAGNQCAGLNLPAAPTGYAYHCAASSTYMNVNGTGWIPINFNSYSAGSVIATLPVDPVNTTSTNLYYTYETDGVGGYKVSAFLQSQKYEPLMGTEGGNDPALYEEGTNLALASGRGLIGDWPLNEGSGMIAYDGSGYGGNGTWEGTASGTSGYYVSSTVGGYGGYFNGVNNYIAPSSSVIELTGAQTITLWIDPTSWPSGSNRGGLVGGGNPCHMSTGGGISLNYCGSALGFGIWNSSTYKLFRFPTLPPLNTWEFIAVSWDGTAGASAMKIYVNGVLAGTNVGLTGPLDWSSASFWLGGVQDAGAGNYFNGAIDDIRIYDYALPLSVIQTIYNAE